MEQITFDQLPQAVTQLCEDIAFIKQHLLEKDKLSSKIETDQWFDLSELCEYLPDKPAKPTIYAYVSANKIPCHKGPKKLRFLKSEIDKWLKEGGKNTISELASHTDAFLSDYKNKKH